ncbi:MAG: glycosyltransferase [Frankiaceae bacterium]|nr:glycosyltransferase [Frankiaceae bacterium]
MLGPGAARRLATGLGRIGAAVLWLPTSYLLAVSVAGLLPPRKASPTSAQWAGRLTVLVPAHDEERGLAATLHSLARCTAPPDGLHVIVVADNCSDTTAEVARRCGVEVWERTSPLRGKGYALRWAMDRLLAEAESPSAVAIVDADTVVDADFLLVAANRLAQGARAVQGVYRAARPHEAALLTRLTDAAAACQSVLRPRGRARLGGAAKLQGNGMVFATDVLRAVPWDAYGVAEDVGYWIRLLRAGIHPVHEPRCGVESAMPTDVTAARVQRARWETGRVEVVREHRWPALRQAWVQHDPVLAEAVVSELVFPPLAPMAGAVAAAALLTAVGTAADRRAGLRTGAAQGAVLVGHALAGLRVTQAPPQTYLALAAAPGVVAWKIWTKLAQRGRPGDWQRTPRP